MTETTGAMRALDGTRGAIRVEDVYDTDIDDLWQACTTPERLARWIAQVSGDLRVGGQIEMLFTSTASTTGRITVCDAPHHLLVTMDPPEDDDSDDEGDDEGDDEEPTEIEAWLTGDGNRTRLVVEERGLPVDKLHFYGAGWQVHLEDLGHALRTGASAHPDGWSERTPSPAWDARWQELIPVYETMAVD